jgi:hypothetical protein
VQEKATDFTPESGFRNIHPSNIVSSFTNDQTGVFILCFPSTACMEEQQDEARKSIPLDTQFQLAIREQRINELLVPTFASFSHPIRMKSSSSNITRQPKFPPASTL